MRTRRKLLLFIVAAAMVLLVELGVHLCMPPKPGVTKENFRGLRQGMTRAEVEAEMGDKSEQEDEGRNDAFVWRNGEVSIHILFDGNGKVKDGAYRIVDSFPSERMADGAWNRFCDWLNDWAGW